ncbi:MAG: NAD(P)-dependent oxidoreductase [Acidobacteriaceae bacterium]|jgi:nucleoside-diphosphate-sugar epimerase
MVKTQNKKIVITGAAGLVGQNLIPRLAAGGFTEIIGIDKHPRNVAVLRQYHPEITVIERDLASSNGDGDPLVDELRNCDALVIAHAQIGGLDKSDFVRNNVTATERVVEAAVRARVPYIVSISSSVVNSMAIDDYTETKKAQEALIAGCGIKQVVLRPTLMFGWFDRKHIGWLARFMQRTPIFPVPGSGRFLRQPLFAADFCDIIVSSILTEKTGAYNITGQQRIDYIDLIRAVKQATGARTRIQKIPYSLFWALLRVNALFDGDPAFTVGQLKALVTPDIFEVIDWPGIFGVVATPLQQALDTTFRDPIYSGVTLDF